MYERLQALVGPRKKVREPELSADEYYTSERGNIYDCVGGRMKTI